MRIACSTMIAPGNTFREKLANLQRYGFEGIEVRLREEEITPQCLAELEEALAESPLGVGAVILVGPSYAMALDSEEAKKAKLACAKKGLEIGARIGAGAFVTPEYRPQPLSLWYPPLKPSADERELLYSFLAEVVEYAEKISAMALLEPINRYETHFYHCIAEVKAVIDDIGSERLRMAVDFFHMNIEEADIARSIESAAGYIRHVQLADSNRRLPGLGHMEFRPGFAALRRIGYDGYLALECRIPDDPERELLACVRYLSRCLEDSRNL
ncbi:MAG: TIM barrel protein [Anaerolineae bacterium]